MNRPIVFILLALAAILICEINAEDEDSRNPRPGRTEERRPPPGRCGRDEVKRTCGRRCEDRCSGPRPSICKSLKCNFSGCRCRDGYARNPYNERCIKIDNCPADGCAEGEFAGHCGRTCEGTCSDPEEPSTCENRRCRRRGCRCDIAGGWVRDSQSENCVRISDCE